MIRLRRGLNSRLALVLFAFAVWLAPAAARADDDATVVARERFKEGVSHFDQKQYDKARVAFLQAYALKKHPSVLLNLAHSELLSGHEADAAKHFSMYLREAKSPTDAERQGAESGLLAAKAVVGEIDIEVEAEGADVYIDGNLEGRSPLPGPAFVEPGTHTLEAKKEGRTASAQISATAGQATSARLRFEAKAAASRPDRGDDEESSDEAPNEPEDEGVDGGRKPFFKWMGETPVAWVGTGLTALGIAGGIGFAVGARTNYDSADLISSQIQDQARRDSAATRSAAGVCANPSQWLQDAGFASNNPDANEREALRSLRAGEYADACGKFTDNQKAGDNMKTLSIVSWAVAGAAAAGTIIYYFVDSGSSSERGAAQGLRVAVLPILSPTERGVGLTGSF